MFENLKTWYEGWGQKLVYTSLLIAAIYIFFKYILGLVAPFVLAWVFSMMLTPAVDWLYNKLNIKKSIGTIIAMVTILFTVLGIVVGFITQISQQIILLNEELPLLQQHVFEIMDNIEDIIQEVGRIIPLPEAFQSVDDLINQLTSYITIFIDDIISVAYSVITGVPNALFFTIVTLIATFFMTKDHSDIKRFINAQIPSGLRQKIEIMKGGLKRALGGYIKTQLILMCLVFVICLIGLVILQRPYALVIALGTAIFDALPVFGSGAVLITWGIYSLIIGDYVVGVGLLSIYALIVVMRQILEPKVLSSQIGVYALVTLMAVYIGLQTIGVFGMIIGPVVVVMFKTLQTIGIIPPFKDSTDNDSK